MRRWQAMAAAVLAGALALASSPIQAADAKATSDAKQYVVYPGGEGPGKGKKVVLLAGDNEYRSEEGLPQLGKILAKRLGFECTVLFSVNAKGEIDPDEEKNIPGIEALDSADLLVLLARFRNPGDDAMKHVDAYLKAGKPVIGLRTATHAFSKLKGDFEKYNYNYAGPDAAWKDGFGRVVLGETWVDHHGGHKVDSTRGVFAPGAAGDPLLSGIADGQVWGSTDVYTVRLPLPGDSKPILLGKVVKRDGPVKKPDEDRNYGMKESDAEPAPPKADKKTGKAVDKNDPMMPIAWTKSYQLPGGAKGHSFATTMGAATDLENEAFRRLLANAACQLTGAAVPAKADVAIVGKFEPSAYGFAGGKKGVKPADHAAAE